MIGLHIEVRGFGRKCYSSLFCGLYGYSFRDTASHCHIIQADTLLTQHMHTHTLHTKHAHTHTQWYCGIMDSITSMGVVYLKFQFSLTSMEFHMLVYIRIPTQRERRPLT